jgi:hypothetical protein
VAALSRTQACDLFLVEIAGSNPAGGTDVCLLLVLSTIAGRGLCDGPITRLEGSYLVGLPVCEFTCNNNHLHL